MPFIENPRAPGVKVEIAFDSGFATPEGSRTWTDVSADASGADGLTIGYGRTDQQSSADPNSLTLTLKNDTGKYTPGNASSPYFPNVKKGKPIRVTVTYAGTSYVRFTGYVNEWPVVWPDGSDRTSQVTITAASRRARLGQTAPLTSAIRAAYLATSPYAYWPLTDNLTNTEGRYVFLDVTNTIVNQKATQMLGVFNTLPAPIIVNDVAQGPTDEGTLVKIPSTTDVNLIGTFSSYVGAGTAVNVNPANDLTIEIVIRIRVNVAAIALATVISLRSRDLTTALEVGIGNDGPDFGWVAESFTIRDATTNAVQDQQISASAPAPYNTATFNSVNDGELHHLAVTLSSTGTVAKFYVDGALESTLTVASPFKFSQRFTNLALGSNTNNATLWIGHAAIHTRALTAAEILTHAQAARAVLETPGNRVVRIAGRIGVPAAEVDVEASAAVTVGPQPESGRSAVEILDELAASTGGILYDTRTGHLSMQSRNHRYNAANTFTLNTASEEIEVDLTTVLNDQYLVNTVELSRIGAEDATPTTLSDATSVSDYGVYSKSMQLASSSDEEVLAAGQDQLYRYATPRTRISQVSVDIGDLTTAQRDLVLTAGVGTLFTLSGLPAQAPAPTMPLFVEGYAENVSTNGGHTITFNTTPGDLYANVMVLDDTAHDALDSGITLAY